MLWPTTLYHNSSSLADWRLRFDGRAACVLLSHSYPPPLSSYRFSSSITLPVVTLSKFYVACLPRMLQHSSSTNQPIILSSWNKLAPRILHFTSHISQFNIAPSFMGCPNDRHILYLPNSSISHPSMRVSTTYSSCATKIYSHCRDDHLKKISRKINYF